MAGFRRTVSIEEMSAKLGDLGKRLPAAGVRAMRASVWSMIRDVTLNRMSGQYLRVRTGTARRSMMGHVERRGDSVRGVIGNPHDYVSAHEEGFKGPVQVRAHTRQLARLERGRGGTVTKKSARKYKARRAKGYKMSAHVRAHTRQLNIRARRFIRDTLADETVPTSATRAAGSGTSRLERRMLRGLEILLDTGRLPKVADLKA